MLLMELWKIKKAVYEQLYKNVEISCTVTYKDKTKETKKIKVTPKIGKISDLNRMD